MLFSGAGLPGTLVSIVIVCADNIPDETKPFLFKDKFLSVNPLLFSNTSNLERTILYFSNS
ncbi:hypothetical protein C1634_022620 [Chryseobacterium viscerum]|uniref:Uncharacterized protein n=1 Tax=Chryseobacterium viscerum TaxID=1037377 RepID=A0A316WAF6_9FLAO|nr:hypothetical protein C1634_022620 [Chryseobacterium viscerum]